MKLTFCDAITLRPYCNYIVGRMRVMCGGSPLFYFVLFVFFCCFVSCRGDYTGRSMRIVTLVLPSLNRIFCFLFFVFWIYSRCRGDYTGGSTIVYSRSPLCWWFFLFYCLGVKMSGRLHRRGDFKLSFSLL